MNNILSSGGRGRRGLNSGLQTPKSSSGLQPDDTFDLFMKDDGNENFPSTPVKSSNVEDMFRLYRISSVSASMLRLHFKFWASMAKIPILVNQ